MRLLLAVVTAFPPALVKVTIVPLALLVAGRELLKIGGVKPATAANPTEASCPISF